MADYKVPIITGTELSEGDLLRWSGSAWVNYADSTYQDQGAVLDDLNVLGASASDGQFLVATGAGTLAWESGATARTSIGLGSVEDTALSTWAGTTNITTLGTIATVGNITIADGGTIGQADGPLLTFDDTSNYLEITGCNIGIGTPAPSAKLHILTGNVADNLKIDSTGDGISGLSIATDGTIKGYWALARTNGQFFNEAVSGDMIFRSESNNILFGRGSGAFSVVIIASNIGIGSMDFGTNATKTYAQATGVAPTTSPADCYQMYSADIAAGHAALHVRNENDTIIKLYQQAHIADAPGDTAANNAITINAILVALETNGLLATE
uniref:Uncharacterized protein n=1 Tax=viral metagenome TaxID=1070528 RepID=A0A6M3J6S5_9ZZZZ